MARKTKGSSKKQTKAPLAKSGGATSSRTADTAEICETFGVADTTVKGWIKQGLGCDQHGPGKPRRFDPAEVASWLKANGRDGRPGRPGRSSPELDAAKLRKETALADLWEMRVMRERSELLPREEVEAGQVACVIAVRQKLLAVAGTLAPSLAGLPAQQIEQKIDERMRAICQEFADGR